MPPDPLLFACPHLATGAEADRDPSYRACDAAPGQPCTWARRHDGEVPPAFHAERLECALPFGRVPDAEVDTLREAILRSGLV